MSFTQVLTEDRRLLLLRLLAESPGYSANSSILHSAISTFGHNASRDQVLGDLVWLEEQELTAGEQVGPVHVAKITERGLDVAQGRARHPGVKRPAPGA
jgi:hypothetical protein